MLTACTTPLPPNPSIYSGLTPEQITILLNTPQEQSFRAQIVQSMESGLHDKRARRVRNCGIFWQLINDGEHTWRQNSSRCGLWLVCLDCAMIRADKYFRKYSMLEALVPAAGFTRITISPDDRHPRDSMQEATDTIRKSLPRAATLAIIKPATGTIEIIYCGPMTVSAGYTLQRTFPGRFSYRRCEQSQSIFHRELKSILAADLPSDPEALAALDAKYIGIRLLRLQGLAQSQREELSVNSGKVYTNNSEDTQVTNNAPKCPICGKHGIKHTRWTSEPASRSKPEWILYSTDVHTHSRE